MEEMISQSLSRKQIAEQCNRSQGSIQYWLTRYSLKTNGVGGPHTAPLPHKCICGETDPDEFYGRLKRKCKACMNLEDLKRVRSYKERAVQEFGGQCVRCGYDKCIAALEFHHTDPIQKDPDFRKMRNWSFERNRAEFEKCELLCANCHREVHYKEL